MRYSTLHWLLIAALSDCYNVRPFTLLSQHLLFLLNVRRGWWEKHIPEDTIFFGFDEKAVGLVIGYLIYIHFQCCFLRCLLPHPGVDALGRMTFTKAAAGSGRGDSPLWHSLAWMQQGQPSKRCHFGLGSRHPQALAGHLGIQVTQEVTHCCSRVKQANDTILI